MSSAGVSVVKQQYNMYLAALLHLKQQSVSHKVSAAAGCGDNAVRLFESSTLQDGEVSSSSDPQTPAFQLALTKQQAHSSDVNCVRWSPQDPFLLATAGDDNTIRLWRYKPDPDSFQTQQ